MTSETVAPVAEVRTPFVLLTMQRTGSGWVMDRINNVASAQGHMELFLHLARQKPPRAGCNDYLRFVEMRPRLPQRQTAAVFEYLDGLYRREGAVGFKLMYSQLRQNPQILHYLVRHRVRIVHLIRENLLDILLSEELARATGTSHVTRDETPQQVQVSLHPATVVRRVRRLADKRRVMRGLLALLALLPNPVEEIAYEALRQDPGEFGRLCGFLGVSAADEDVSRTNLVKRQNASHREVLLNYQEVQAALRRGGYARLLH